MGWKKDVAAGKAEIDRNYKYLGTSKGILYNKYVIDGWLKYGVVDEDVATELQEYNCEMFFVLPIKGEAI